MNKNLIKFLNPANLILGLWSFLFIIYYASPIYLLPKLSFKGFLFVFFSVFIFFLGTLPLKINRFKTSSIKKKQHLYTISPGINFFFLILAISGLLLGIFLKIYKLEFFLNTEAFNFLRNESARNLLYVESINFNLFSWLSFFLYPAGFVALVSILMNFEGVKFRDILLLYFFVFLVIVYSIISASRINIFLILVFTTIVELLRRSFGNSSLLSFKEIRLPLFFLLLYFIFYSSYIFSLRSQFSSFESYVSIISDNWGFVISDNFFLFLSSNFTDSININFVSSVIYFLQNFSITERFLNGDKFDLLFGAYTSDVINVAFHFFDSSTNYLRLAQLSLHKAKIYGFFSGAWTGFQIDFGMFSYLFIFIWGRISGLLFRLVLNNGSDLIKVCYVIVPFTILLSFISAPGGVANSTLIIFWFFLFYLLCNRNKDDFFSR